MHSFSGFFHNRISDLFLSGAVRHVVTSNTCAKYALPGCEFIDFLNTYAKCSLRSRLNPMTFMDEMRRLLKRNRRKAARVTRVGPEGFV